MNTTPTDNNGSGARNKLTTLLITHIMGLMPAARHHALVCSSGPLGYHALKEMLQNGVPGHTLLLETDDVMGVDKLSRFTRKACLRVFYYEKYDSTTNSPFARLILFGSMAGYANSQKNISKRASHLTIYSNMTVLPDSLLGDCNSPSTIDISPLPQGCVSMVGRSFLEGLRGLKAIDLSPLSGVTAIGAFFLAGCSSLTSIDLTPLSQVKTMGAMFLEGCSGLTMIDLSPLKVHADGFLNECSGLTSIDLTSLSHVTKVERSFLSGCRGLTSIDLSPLSSVTDIHEGFLSACTGLTELDLTPLSNLTGVVAMSFLYNCSGLTSLDLNPLSQVTGLGWNCLSGCSSLTTIDMTALVHIPHLPMGFNDGRDVPAVVLLPPQLENTTNNNECKQQ